MTRLWESYVRSDKINYKDMYRDYHNLFADVTSSF